ncbi:hypothetical protein H0H92_003086 [Tricholoma furcatifolium]|nr:hypothetical protein H0H92_003086 [Tricholoma furcatifolium]
MPDPENEEIRDVEEAMDWLKENGCVLDDAAGLKMSDLVQAIATVSFIAGMPAEAKKGLKAIQHLSDKGRLPGEENEEVTKKVEDLVEESKQMLGDLADRR